MPSLHPSRPRRPVVETLDERVLYSADPATAVVAAVAAPVSVMQVTTQAAPPVVAQAPAARELVVIDSRVPDSERLIADLHAQQIQGRAIDVLLVTDDQDPISAISGRLNEAPGVYSAVHVISHGDAGSLELGDLTLNLQTVRARADELSAWSSALAPGADLLLYGCDVAAGSNGKALVDGLAALTGADVAASTDATGDSLLGGNWILEYQVGRIDTPSALDLAGQQAWHGLLADPAESQLNDTSDPVNSSGDSYKGRHMATNAAGMTVVVWQADANGSGQGSHGTSIRATVLDASGQPVKLDFQINQTTQDTSQPSVAIAANGNFVVVWTADNVDGSGKGVYAAMFDASGNRLAGVPNDFRVNDLTAGDQYSPSVAFAPDGRFAVAWVSSESITGDSIVRARVFGATGTPAAAAFDIAPFALLDPAAGDQLAPSIAWLDNNKLVTAWQYDSGDLLVGTDVYGRVLNSDGTAATASFRVNGGQVLGDQITPDVQATPAGGFVVVWTDDAPLLGGISARLYNNSGAPVAAQTQVTSNLNNSVDTPSVAVAADGSMWVAWERKANGTWGIFARQYTSTLTAVAAEQQINTAVTTSERSPTISIGPTRTLVSFYDPSGSHPAVVLHQLVTVANQAPTISGPTAVSVASGQSVTFSVAGGNGLTVGDSDAAGGLLKLTLTATHGTFVLATGSSPGPFTSKVLVGTLADLNAALDGLRFTASAGFTGGATLNLVLNDQGNTGTGGAKSATHGVGLAVTVVDQPPALAVNTGVQVSASGVVTIDTSALRVEDPDDTASNLLFTVLQAPASGQLLLDGVVLNTGDHFSQADIDLSRLTYRAGAVAATDVIRLSVRDPDNLSTGPFDVAARTDAPVSAPASAPDPEVVQAPVEAPSSASTGSTGSATTPATTAATTAATTVTATGPTASAASTISPLVGASIVATTPASSSAVSDNQLATASTAVDPVAVTASSGRASVVAAIGAPVTGSAAAIMTPIIAPAGPASTRSADEIRSESRSSVVPYSETSPGASSLSIDAATSAHSAPIGSSAAVMLPSSLQVLQQPAFRESLATLHQELDQTIRIDRNLVASSAAVSAGFSIGYVIWAVRGGVLLSSLLASMPAWRAIDPLPVLDGPGRSSAAKGGDDGEAEDDSLVGMLERSARRAAQAAGLGTGISSGNGLDRASTSSTPSTPITPVTPVPIPASASVSSPAALPEDIAS